VNTVADEFESIFFEHLSRTLIELKHLCPNSRQLQLLECKLDGLSDCGSGNTPPPVGTSDPVAQFAPVVGADPVEPTDPHQNGPVHDGKSARLPQSLLMKTLINELLGTVLGIGDREACGWSEVWMTNQTLHGHRMFVGQGFEM
jgi:hypothetical protein